MPSAGTAPTGTVFMRGASLELLRHHGVDRQDDGAAGSRRLDHDLAGGLGEIVLAERLADAFAAARARKVLAMPPPMTSASTFLTRLSSRSSLVEILAPPTMATTGRSAIAEALLQRFELGLHGAAGIGRQEVGETFGRGVRAVGGGEGVVDEDVAIGGQLRRRPRSFFSSPL